jgi:uncharacterized membrane protein
VSTIAGAALAVAGYQRLSRPVRFLGLGLIARGVSGWCPVTAATDYGSDAFDDQTKRHLGGSRGIIVQDAITIYRPVDEVYAYWRNLENLPRFMDHLEDVRIIDRLRSHWVARGPLGVLVEWDADIINDIPPTLLSWKSVGRSDIATAGSVRFKAEGPNETLVQVKLQYDPPAGKVGQKVASLLGEDPQLRIAQNLLQFKLLLEDGLTGTATGYRAAPESQHVRRDFDPDLEPLH